MERGGESIFGPPESPHQSADAGITDAGITGAEVTDAGSTASGTADGGVTREEPPSAATAVPRVTAVPPAPMVPVVAPSLTPPEGEVTFPKPRPERVVPPAPVSPPPELFVDRRASAHPERDGSTISTALRRELSWAWGLGGVVLICALGLAEFWPNSPIDGNHLPGGGFGDPPQGVWFIAWIRYAITHLVNPFHTLRIDFPTGVNLANNTSSPFLGLIAFPITVFLGPISAFNLLLRLAVVLSGLSMWGFLRSICTSRRAPFIGALLYGFSPYLATEIQGDAHLDLAFVAAPPLIAWTITALLRGTKRPRLVGATLGLLSGIQILIASEILSDLVLVVVVGAFVTAIVAPKKSFATLRRLFWPGVIALVVFAIVGGYPIWYGAFGPGHLTGPVQPSVFLQQYSADLLGPIVPSVHQLLAPSSLTTIANKFAYGNLTENLAYISLPLLLLLVFIGIRLRHHRAVLAALGLAVVAFVLSLGSHLTIDGTTTTIPLPEQLLVHVPLLNSTVPSRFALEVILFSAIALSIGIDHLWEREPTGRLAEYHDVSWFAILVLCGALIVPKIATNTTPLNLSAINSIFAAIPENTVVLTYPFPKTPNTGPMLWQAENDLSVTLMGGYATVNGSDNAGVATAPLLSPPSVQEYLVESQEGGAFFYPPILRSAATESDLCTFIAKYNVGAVVDLLAGGSGVAVQSYFTKALGPPVVTLANISLYQPNGHCPTGTSGSVTP